MRRAGSRKTEPWPLSKMSLKFCHCMHDRHLSSVLLASVPTRHQIDARDASGESSILHHLPKVKYIRKASFDRPVVGAYKHASPLRSAEEFFKRKQATGEQRHLTKILKPFAPFRAELRFECNLSGTDPDLIKGSQLLSRKTCIRRKIFGAKFEGANFIQGQGGDPQEPPSESAPAGCRWEDGLSTTAGTAG